MTLYLYGIPNCDSVKKARKWLDERAIDYTFHDYRREGVDAARLRAWADITGWEALLNRRGTTFRKLNPAEKANLDADKAIRLMVAHPSLIKRPVVEHDGSLLVGFDDSAWAAAFA